MSDKAKWFLIVVAAGFSIGVLSVYFISISKTNSETATPSITKKVQKPVVEEQKKEAKQTPEIKEETLPERIVLNVPFYSQAPFAVWDSLHKEACEEASVLMVMDYFSKTKRDLNSQDSQLIEFIDWQTSVGYKVDLTVKQLAEATKSHYAYNGYNIITNPSIEDIKKQIAEGRPVIVPAAGQLLDNPYFTAPGPVYHMLVIKGYDKNGFIVNDPGTRRGEGFHYSYNNLYSSIYDWNAEDILKGSKKVLVYSG